MAVKHALDVVLALAALTILSPLMALIALLVRLSSPGPVIYRQVRIGRHGQPFEMLKFRSMEIPSEGRPSGLSLGREGASRTPIGGLLSRAALDELPQLVNVLRGEMSLIGPRPEEADWVAYFATEIRGYSDRHRVKPGVTGWAQVNGIRGLRASPAIRRRAELDNYYIDNWSVLLDLRIVLLTPVAVLRGLPVSHQRDVSETQGRLGGLRPDHVDPADKQPACEWHGPDFWARISPAIPRQVKVRLVKPRGQV